MDDNLYKAALEYHRSGKPGKISVTPTKQLTNQRDLSLAYSPGVAAACDAIVADPSEARNLTARGNLVGVVTNGTAVLGLGAIGPLAAKPVMEGKGVLFKKFADIDVFDIELDENDPDRLVDIIAAMEPTFGGINLEDIKAPDCFYVERKLRERMKIPVFHDDQHGTAIVVAAAMMNALDLLGKRLDEVKVVASGAGAAALACLDLLVSLGVSMSNVMVTDIKGVVYKGRLEEMDDNKARYARETTCRTLGEVIGDADVFLGLSAGGVLKPDMVARMAANPVIFALANPIPEITPAEIQSVRNDAIIATGRSDYPNQVNNVLCFPYIFRGALDVGATVVNDAMKLAAVKAIASLARAEQSEVVAAAYQTEQLDFGREYLIPKPFDPRLIVKIAPAVALAAMESGVATRPIEDFAAYEQHLNDFVYQSGMFMRPLFAAAKKSPKRIVYCEGENEKVLRAVQVVLDEGLAYPILIGRPQVIEDRISRYGLRMKIGSDIEVVNPDSDQRFREFWQTYHGLMERRGITPDSAKTEIRRRTTLIGAMMVRLGYADGILCGTSTDYRRHLRFIDQVYGRRPGANIYAAMNLLILPKHTLFICDTYINCDPTAQQIAEMTLLAAEEVRRFGMIPKVALVSHSAFGSDSEDHNVQKMQIALGIIREKEPELEVEGEMHGDMAVNEELRSKFFPNSRLVGGANLLIMPNLESANISFNLLKETAGDGLTIGPILLGASRPGHILTPSATVRRIVNMTALTVVDANAEHGVIDA